MREHLCIVLSKHVGKPITSELAVEMLRELFPDKTPDPLLFGCIDHNGYIIQCELFRDILDELAPLHVAHYAETEAYRAGIPLKGDNQNIMERERAGGLIQVTARAPDGRLAGHIRGYLTTSAHTCTLIAVEDALFLAKEHRGGFMAAKMVRFYESCMWQLGAQEIYLDVKLINRADSLARYLKYTPIATRFVKVIADSTQAQECLSLLKEKPCVHPTPPITAD